MEIRNDIAGNAILDGTPPSRIRRLAEAAGVRILSINALQRFDDWRAPRPIEAAALADYAQACGAEALVLVPCNDGSRPDRLLPALEGLRADPAGARADRARRAARVRDLLAAAEVGGGGGDRRGRRARACSGWCTTPSTITWPARRTIFPELTGLVHISGVDDPGLARRRRCATRTGCW